MTAGKRRSGILLHVTSLPSDFGVGDLGPRAHRFVDLLAGAGQTVWQVLPLTPTLPAYGNSPYSSPSAFAGNTLLISPEVLRDDGWLDAGQARPGAAFPAEWCDYEAVAAEKEVLFDRAFKRFRDAGAETSPPFRRFAAREARWLRDYALFTVLKREFGGAPWPRWPKAIREREPRALGRARREHGAAVAREMFLQFLFQTQWDRLRERAREKGVRLFGDLPIYVNHDSADVWAHPRLFQLKPDGSPRFVAGVPPDYFSRTGQLWGNPVYDWTAMAETGFAWWERRMERTFRLFDLTRIDHFRGLVGYWRVKGGARTAARGRWVPAPWEELFGRMTARFGPLPVVAEDLGTITPDVRRVMERLGYPGMKVLLFAFGSDDPDQLYLPHNFDRRSVVYTGTHDNNTVRGWFEAESAAADRERLFAYVGRTFGAADAAREMIRLAQASVAETAIIPLQDVLGLGAETRMNMPSTPRDNWRWRVRPEELCPERLAGVAALSRVYGRCPR